MSTLSQLRIGTRLALAFAGTLALTVVLALAGYFSLQLADKHIDNIVHNNVRKMTLLTTMSEQAHIVSRVLRTVVLLDDEAAMATEQRKVDEARARYDKAWQELAKMPTASPAAAALRERIESGRTSARATNNKVMELARANQDEEALKLLLTEAAPKVADWQAALHENVQMQEQATEAAYQETHETDARAELTLLALCLLAIVAGGVGALLVTRSITAPLQQAMRAAERVRDGDLATPIEAQGRDEVAQLLCAMAEMQQALARVVGEVRSNAESVATASGQIAQGNQDLSQRTEEQASSLQQTAATMDELGATVRTNADNATQANQLAQQASQVASRGGAVVGEVVETMRGISESSRRISDIIGTIDGIAFQTNILALERGRGSGACRRGRAAASRWWPARCASLAQRSAEAAKEIKSADQQPAPSASSSGTAAGGSRPASTMGEVVASIRRVTDIMGEISVPHPSSRAAAWQQVGQAVSADGPGDAAERGAGRGIGGGRREPARPGQRPAAGGQRVQAAALRHSAPEPVGPEGFVAVDALAQLLGAEAGQATRLAAEMRLVAVAGLQRDLGPTGLALCGSFQEGGLGARYRAQLAHRQAGPGLHAALDLAQAAAGGAGGGAQGQGLGPVAIAWAIRGHPLAVPVKSQSAPLHRAGASLPSLPSGIPSRRSHRALGSRSFGCAAAHQSPIRIKAIRVATPAPGGLHRPRKPSVPRRVQSLRPEAGTDLWLHGSP